MKDETLKVVLVISSAMKTPEVESKAEARIFAMNFVLRRQLDYVGKRAQRGGVSGTAGQQRVRNRLQRFPALRRKAYPHRIHAIVVDDRGSRRFAFHNGAGIGGNFFRREPGAGGDGGVDLECNRRPRNRVFEAVQHKRVDRVFRPLGLVGYSRPHRRDKSPVLLRG